MARSPAFQLRVGRLVSESLGIYFRNLIPFVFLGIVVLLPWIGMQLWVSTAVFSRGTASLVGLLAVIVQSLFTYLLTGAITYGVVMQLRGTPAGLASAIAKGTSSFLRVLGTALYCGLRIVLFSLLLYIPGIIESVRLFVAIPVAVMEGTAGSAAAKRSTALVRGSGWPLFGAWFLVMFLGFAIGFLVAFVTLGADPEANPDNPWLNVAIAVPLNTFFATMSAVAYFQLRKGKENVDAAEIAKVFD